MKFTIICVFSCLKLITNAQIEILNTDFQVGIPSNYSIVDNDGNTPDSSVLNFDNAWISIQDPNDSLNYVAGSTSFFTPIGTASRWLITPKLNLGTFGNTIQWRAKSHDASFPDDYLVLVSKTDSLISSFYDTIDWVIEESFEWNTRSVDLSSLGYNNENVYIAFVNNTNDGFKLYIDDIQVLKETPAGITEHDKYQLSVYPNPTTDFLTLNTELKNTKIKLTTLDGQLIEIPKQENKLDFRRILPGVYLLTVENLQVKLVKRIIKN
jgi:hypothetical protein